MKHELDFLDCRDEHAFASHHLMSAISGLVEGLSNGGIVYVRPRDYREEMAALDYLVGAAKSMRRMVGGALINETDDLLQRLEPVRKEIEEHERAIEARNEPPLHDAHVKAYEAHRAKHVDVPA